MSCFVSSWCGEQEHRDWDTVVVLVDTHRDPEENSRIAQTKGSVQDELPAMAVFPCGTLHLRCGDTYLQALCLSRTSGVVEDGIAYVALEEAALGVKPVVYVLFGRNRDIDSEGLTVVSAVETAKVARLKIVT